MKYLFFSPNSGIWQHALSEAAVVKTLKSLGHQVVHIQCDRFYSDYCVTMSAHGLRFTSDNKLKNKICNKCVSCAKILNSHLHLETENINNFIDEDISGMVDEKVNELKNLQIDKIKWFNVNLNKIATYNIILEYKINNLNLIFERGDIFEHYISDYKKALQTYYGFLKYFKNRIYDGFFCYNGFYSTNQAVILAAKENNIPVFWLHSGGPIHNRLHTLNVGLGHHYDILQKWQLAWKKSLKFIPASSKAITEVKNHFLSLLKGINYFVFSKSEFCKEGIHSRFNIPLNSKIILAAMSSQDERIAVEAIDVLPVQLNLPFANQFSWINAVIDYFKDKENFTVIIRLHPRDFPNRRDPVLSGQAIEFKKVFNDLPKNIIINYPSDNISIYQLACVTDVCLHAGSSVGKEFSLLGIPCVNYMSNGLSYPADLSFFGFNKIDYFNAVEKALSTDWSYESCRNAFRWCGVEYYHALFQLDNYFTALDENRKPGYIYRVFNKLSPNLVKKIMLILLKPIKQKEVFDNILNNNDKLKIDYSLDHEAMDESQEKYLILIALSSIVNILRKKSFARTDDVFFNKLSQRFPEIFSNLKIPQRD